LTHPLFRAAIVVIIVAFGWTLAPLWDPWTGAWRWDTASSDGELSDYSAGTTWLVKGDQLFLMDVLRQRMDYPTLKKTVIHYARQYFAQVILVENKGSGMSLIQDLRSGNFPVIACRPEADKTTRMATASVLFESGAALLPEKAVWLDDFEAELFAFPNGRHDDQVDSTSQALNWFIKRQQQKEEMIGPAIQAKW
jgi:predicted phage terminase large subunit-like protein